VNNYIKYEIIIFSISLDKIIFEDPKQKLNLLLTENKLFNKGKKQVV
jgi:hypothetical protein